MQSQSWNSAAEFKKVEDLNNLAAEEVGNLVNENLDSFVTDDVVEVDLKDSGCEMSNKNHALLYRLFLTALY